MAPPVKADEPALEFGGDPAADGSSNAWDSYDTVFLNAKAGMDGVDKKKVQKVVYDMSKGSKYFHNEQRKEAEVAQRIERMTALAASLTPAQLADHEKATDLKIAELEAARDLSRVWVHVDMDAFYAAVEELVNPSLVGKPVAVGGMSMICTANYEARKFGVRAAMPGFIARKLCPNLIFVRPDFKKYSHYSELSRQVFRQYDADFVARSLDEAFVDITASCQSRNMSAAEVTEELRSKVHSATGLSCSAGVGPNRLLAKVCSDINKPNGQYVLRQERAAVMNFVSSLPIRKVNGIGKVTERLLKEVLQISTCADLLSKRAFVCALFSEISTDFLLAVGLGIGGSETPEKESRKSLSNERTFAAISDDRQLFRKLEELVELLAKDMQKEDLHGRTLTLKLKETGFEVRSRAITLPNFISTKPEIWEHAAKLLKRELPLSVRLMGLRISNFKDEKPDPSQRTLASFVTQSSGTGRARVLSNSPNKASCSSSDGHHDSEGRGECQRFSSNEQVHGDNKQDCSHPSNTGIPKMPQRASPSRSAQTPFSNPQAQHGLTHAAPESTLKGTAMLKNAGPVQTKMEDVLRFREEVAGSCEGGEAVLKEANMARALDSPSKKERDTSFLREGSDPKMIEDLQQEDAADGRVQLKDHTTALEAVEPGWEALQSRYDSVQDQIWADSGRCGLCGAEVKDGVRDARQEHEDFHFALWIQKQQAEESGCLPRSGTITLTPAKKESRPAVGRDSGTKRKAAKGKTQRNAQRRSSHRTLEAFFSKPNCE